MRLPVFRPSSTRSGPTRPSRPRLENENPSSPIEKHFVLQPSLCAVRQLSCFLATASCAGLLPSRRHTEPKTESKAVARKDEYCRTVVTFQSGICAIVFPFFFCYHGSCQWTPPAPPGLQPGGQRPMGSVSGEAARWELQIWGPSATITMTTTVTRDPAQTRRELPKDVRDRGHIHGPRSYRKLGRGPEKEVRSVGEKCTGGRSDSKDLF
ncbi:hypothetical protein EDB86DRAFT_2275145 [Lactarius hatsudake]|nr:hypothetical protein EDB86DRAFT_2275145 [Lactarius hatsudake]